jgi:hypothetical protein
VFHCDMSIEDEYRKETDAIVRIVDEELVER